MASEAQQMPGGAREDGQGLRLVLDLTVDDAGAVCGTVGLVDGSFRRPFHGWIDLMSAISTLGAAAGPAGGA